MIEPTCCIDGCDGSVLAKGMCNKHYLRMRRRGTTDAPAQRLLHGTSSGYTYHRCRCDECKAFQREAHRAWRARARSYPADRIPHGEQGYNTYGCRCDICRTDHRDYRREQRLKRATA
jgi:hypothetical protein